MFTKIFFTFCLNFASGATSIGNLECTSLAVTSAKDKYEKTPIDSARHTYKYEPVEQEKFDQMMPILEGNVELL